jgi:citrate synthase
MTHARASSAVAREQKFRSTRGGPPTAPQSQARRSAGVCTARSRSVETLIAAARGPQDVPRVVGELLRRGEKIPGFGHFVYRSGDPRAVMLLGLVRRAAPKSGQLAVAEAVLAEVRRKSLPEPDIDFAVATLARVAGMVPGAGEAVFAVAPHGRLDRPRLEACAGGGPLRPRAACTGPPAIIDP